MWHGVCHRNHATDARAESALSSSRSITRSNLLNALTMIMIIRHVRDTAVLQGACKEAPGSEFTRADLDLGIDHHVPWRAPLCVLVVDEDLFITDRSRLWLDSLYIQIINRPGKKDPVALRSAFNGQMYVSNSVVQSNGRRDDESEGTCVKVYRGVGGMYVRGVIFSLDF